jgi:hypothetical protein
MVWTGAIDNDWNKTVNWTPHLVPSSDNNVLIPVVTTHYPVINNAKLTPARCKNMTINSNASVTIGQNKGLTVHGDMLNNGFFHIKSTGVSGSSVHHAHDGSLLILGARNGAGTYKIDRYISGNFWHMVSSPITSATASVFTNMWIRTYNEHNNTWGSFITSPTAPLTTGVGVAVWTYQTSDIRSFNGTINHGTVPLIVKYTDNPNANQFQKGWNLVGNPYPSAISWNQLAGWTKQNISGTIYLFSAEFGNYITWNGFAGAAGPVIAMGQGFFVQTNNQNTMLTPSISINNAARLHSEVNFRNEELIDNMIEISISGNQYADKTYIILKDDASEQYDFSYDASKLDGLFEAPQLYTYKGDAKLACNVLPSSTNISGKLIYLNVGEQNSYTLDFEHTFNNGFVPVILDRQTNTIIQANQAYTFTANPNDIAARFEILDYNSITSTEDHSESAIHVWENNNFLYVGNFERNKTLHITLYDILGAEVLHSNNRITSLESLSTGIYMVRVITDKQTVVTKITVQ